MTLAAEDTVVWRKQNTICMRLGGEPEVGWFQRSCSCTILRTVGVSTRVLSYMLLAQRPGGILVYNFFLV